MAHSSKLSKTIQRWVSENPDKAESYHVERDEFGDPTDGPYSHWIYLRDGWVWGEVHCVHEVNVKDAMAALAEVTEEA